jgi:hypothetical protein
MMTAPFLTSFESVRLCNTDKPMFWLLQRTGIMWREVSRSEQWVQRRPSWILIQPRQLVSESMFTHREMIASRKNMNWKLTMIFPRFDVGFYRNSDEFILTLIAELSHSYNHSRQNSLFLSCFLVRYCRPLSDLLKGTERFWTVLFYDLDDIKSMGWAHTVFISRRFSYWTEQLPQSNITILWTASWSL